PTLSTTPQQTHAHTHTHTPTHTQTHTQVHTHLTGLISYTVGPMPYSAQTQPHTHTTTHTHTHTHTNIDRSLLENTEINNFPRKFKKSASCPFSMNTLSLE